MGKTRQLAIFGAFGGVNIGDEVILESDLALAKAAGYETPVTVIATVDPNALESSSTYSDSDVEIIFFKDFRKAFKALWGKDLFIGGGQVIDGSSGPKMPVFQCTLALWAKLSGGRVTVGGVGVYKVDHWLTRAAYGLLFRLCSDVSVRDQASLKALNFSAAARKRGRCAADVVFSLDVDANPVEPRKRIGLAVHAAPHVSYMDFDAALALLKALCSCYGSDVDILVHDNRENFDLKFARELSEALAAQDVHVSIISFDTVDACLAYYKTAKVVVSARMHPLIIGAISGCGCVPLEGSSKVAEFAKLAALKDYPLAGTQTIMEAVKTAEPISKPILDGLALKAKTTLT